MRTPKQRIRHWAWIGVAILVAAGCDRDPRLANARLPKNTETRTVEHYGITLGPNATPKQVAYVLLRAIREDFTATTPEDRRVALDRQYDVCAADAIVQALPLGLTREETLYRVVNRWTPTVAHYVGDFETEWEKAQARLVEAKPNTHKTANGDVLTCRVLMEVHDPDSDLQGQVVVVMALVQERGYWRVGQIGFVPNRRSLKRANAKARSPSTNG